MSYVLKPVTAKVNIDWNYIGKPDGLAGTGSTLTERLLAYGFAVLATATLVGFLRIQDHPATFGWRLWLLIFFVFDVVGGVVANILNSCKRMYHTPVQPGENGFIRLVKNPLAFTTFHIHPIIFAWAYFGNPWVGAIWYVALVTSVAVTLSTPLYLRRPIAMTFVLAAIFINLYGPSLAPGLDWFIPCLFLKIVLAHSDREEPYRPMERAS